MLVSRTRPYWGKKAGCARDTSGLSNGTNSPCPGPTRFKQVKPGVSRTQAVFAYEEGECFCNIGPLPLVRSDVFGHGPLRSPFKAHVSRTRPYCGKKAGCARDTHPLSNGRNSPCPGPTWFKQVKPGVSRTQAVFAYEKGECFWNIGPLPFVRGTVLDTGP